MGDAIPFAITVMSRLVDLHDNLLADGTGRTINGIGAILLTVLCFTGAVIWWPGTDRWRRSLGVRRNVGWKRFSWDLHSAIGFWMFALLFIWAVSGIYMAFPGRLRWQSTSSIRRSTPMSRPVRSTLSCSG
jgi:uncharacterized iron-regulated membrane protein